MSVSKIKLEMPQKKHTDTLSVLNAYPS